MSEAPDFDLELQAGKAADKIEELERNCLLLLENSKADVKAICDLEINIVRLKRENERYRGALRKLANMEAFTNSFMPDKKTKEWKELEARMNFAESCFDPERKR